MGFVARWFTPSDSDQHGQGDSSSIGQAFHAGDNTKMPLMPSAPTEKDAKGKAAEEMKRMRRMRAMAGGKTLLTSEGMGEGTGSGGKTLLGA